MTTLRSLLDQLRREDGQVDALLVVVAIVVLVVVLALVIPGFDL